ncbi:hypothetical protein GGR54DRAFT_136588 [Hypoxylon sp. NC1633]|nr:hypothetical protein GGR54DRAFT_136588 [Hypoxylon sp. NC1633]
MSDQDNDQLGRIATKRRGNTVADVHDRIDKLEVKLNERFASIDNMIKSMSDKFDELDEKFDQFAAYLISIGLQVPKTLAPPKTPTSLNQTSTTNPTKFPRIMTPESNNELAKTQRTEYSDRPEVWKDHTDTSFPRPWQPLGSRTNTARLPNGKLNLHRTNLTNEARTWQENKVKTIWPEVVLTAEAERFAGYENRNTVWVVLPSNLKLVWADKTVLEKLGKIQDHLRTGLVPYALWTTRATIELSGDFQQVAMFARACSPDWVTFVEAVLQVLEERHVLNSFVATFATLVPHKNESVLSYARRLREAYYRLPVRDRDERPTREILISALRKYTPSVWLSVEYHIKTLGSGQIVEQAVRTAEIVMRTEIESQIFGTPAMQLQCAAAPPLSTIQTQPKTMTRETSPA